MPNEKFFFLNKLNKKDDRKICFQSVFQKFEKLLDSEQWEGPGRRQRSLHGCTSIVDKSIYSKVSILVKLSFVCGVPRIG